ncbi:beta-glucosidase-5 [Coleophoma cylindrospora]|uniref:beta-glucosidase n=1 Tax=Coleophoma cylindrospora TaxID=1849047 RepID=A0A3D8QTY2_9HELO|nr:beta-glucosidase-5 [Coleophoma cylindrospora]
MGSQAPPVFDVEELLEQLTLDEKVALTAGKDFWHTVPIPRLQIPSIRLSDGPNGVRGTRFFDGVPAACLPCGTAIGATFDKALLRSIGQLLAAEARAKGAHVLLGPTINIQRAPLGGRGFESYSEDPYLAGVLAGMYCKGVQEGGIVATLKHFVCNDQEHERMAVNSILTERALREIYLLPFMLAIKLSQAGAIMTAYNQVNGVHAAENAHLLKDILRDEWKWDGLIMSDWFGTYSTTGAIKAGLDLEMPGPTRWRGAALTHAVTSNKVKMSTLDARVRAVLKLVNTAIKSGVPEAATEHRLDREQDRQLLRGVAAQSIVLLKNEEEVLPFNKEKRIAVIGPNAKIATICGGGSASLNPYYTVTPFDGVSAKAQAGVEFAQGVYGHQSLPLLGKLLKTEDGQDGFLLKVYNEPPEASKRTLIEERRLTDSMMFFIDYNHPDLNTIWYANAEGIFSPDESGVYDFGLCLQGTGRLYVDDELIVTNVDNQRSGPSFLGSGTLEEVGSKALDAGKPYRIRVEWGCGKTSKLKRPGTVDFGHGGFRFGGCKQLDPKEAIAKAAELAKTVDQVVLFAGLSGEYETEGDDREHMDLPKTSDELIWKVLEANPNTVIVIQSGTPVTMPWADKAKAVLQAWYGGNETGNGIADVLYGDVNPSGRLPLTIPRRLEDNPAYLNYRSEGGRVLYGEDVYVGYRYFEKVGIKPLFPFGHGLSYTTFQHSDLKVQKISSKEVAIVTKVTNTGSRAGAEVLQVYLAHTAPKIRRPAKELKGFEKVFLQPGESALVEIVLDLPGATSFWDEYNEKWCSQEGVYKVLVGSSSAGSLLESSFDVEKTSFWLGL